MKPKRLLERGDHTEEGGPRKRQHLGRSQGLGWDRWCPPGPHPRPGSLGSREYSHGGQNATASSGLHGPGCSPAPSLLLESPSRNTFQVDKRQRGL